MTAVCAIAPAKLNLTLEVLGRREDGYHDLESVVIHLDLADELQLTPSATREISYRDDAGRRVAILSDDIVDRTWDRLIELDGERGWKRVPAGGRLEVRKRIPIAAGLGGGSADAAAFLRLARLAWGAADRRRRAERIRRHDWLGCPRLPERRAAADVGARRDR